LEDFKVKTKSGCDKENYIDPTDRQAVIDAANDLDLLVYTDVQDLKNCFDGYVIEADEDFPFTKLMEFKDVDDEVYKVIASEASDDPNHPLTVWLEIYGWELHRKER
jgi:hypothetical protein